MKVNKNQEIRLKAYYIGPSDDSEEIHIVRLKIMDKMVDLDCQLMAVHESVLIDLIEPIKENKSKKGELKCQ
jgi:hypothetical protein